MIILLHNVDALEIYEDAIRQAAAAAYTTEAGGAAGVHHESPSRIHPTTPHMCLTPPLKEAGEEARKHAPAPPRSMTQPKLMPSSNMFRDSKPQL